MLAANITVDFTNKFSKINNVTVVYQCRMKSVWNQPFPVSFTLLPLPCNGPSNPAKGLTRQIQTTTFFLCI